ncbi:hypothetical protein QJS10_CPB19g01953 [Acorus calamus]|uniref:RRP12-like protein n=1 Tax=Acorus calamus TaxID=4465 RepID=A0AAV9CG76_ACOCL|nr:hypothetical protein QJS10_CPB19g01953 [Acorus calamus]
MSMKFKNKTLKYFSELLKVRESIVTRHIMEILHALCYSPSSHVSPERVVGTLVLVGIVCYCLKTDLLMEWHQQRGCCMLVLRREVQHIFLNPEGEERRSGPTIIEKICATIESLLGYQYSAVWDMSFQVVSAMFGKLGESSYFLMRGTIKSLEDMQKLPDEDLACRKQLEKEALFVSSRSVEGLVYSLWSLLPAFCNYPLDTAKSFEGLTVELCYALRNEPELRGIICSSLQILIQQNKRALALNTDTLNDEVGNCALRAKDHYTSGSANENLNAISSSAKELKILPVLFEIFKTSSKDSGGYLQATIHELASISVKKDVKHHFKKIIYELITATKKDIAAKQQNSDSIRVDSDGGTSHSLERLRYSGDNILYDAIRHTLKDEEGLLQKKAYKILSIILKEREEFLLTKLEELLKLMIDVLPDCHFSAKRHRLDSLYYIIVSVSKDPAVHRKSDIISSFLTEIILALKEANKKTRNRAYDLLVKIGHAYGDEEQGGKKENLQQFFNMVAGGLAGETPHMISAAVKGLARLTYEFSDLVNTAYNVLPSAFLLLQRKNREIIKANLGLLKVLVAKSQVDGLQKHLRSMVEGMLKWQDGTKNHFLSKVKLLLEMLVRKCGLDAVRAVMPEEHMKLLTNIRKTKERKEKKAKSVDETQSVYSKTSTSRLSRWNHTRIFSDFGEDASDDDSEAQNSLMKTISGRQTKATSIVRSKAVSSRSMRRMNKVSKSLPEDLGDKLEDDPLDLLDHKKTRLALQSMRNLKRKADSDDAPEIDSEGRLVIHEDGNPKRESLATSSDRFSEARSQTGSHYSGNSTTRAQKKQRRPSSDSGYAYTGNEYTSKKARGDLKKEGKLEPYAYWPLDRKLLNRREERRATARKGMARVVKLSKKLEGRSVSSALSVNASKFKRNQKKGGKKNR